MWQRNPAKTAITKLVIKVPSRGRKSQDAGDPPGPPRQKGADPGGPECATRMAGTLF